MSAAVHERNVDAVRRSARRLYAVRETGLLDTPVEGAFDRLTRLTCRVLNVPATYMSLVDEQRDFYLSTCGFPEPISSGRNMTGPTFCQYAITSNVPLVIDDVLTVPVLRDLPAVKVLGVRAYAGIPLVAGNGDVIGAFCALDNKPREWTAVDLETLTGMADSALREVMYRTAVRRAERHEAAAKRRTEAREEVLNVVAHDLRTPVSVIGTASYTLSMLALPKEGLDAVQSVRAASGLISTLIHDLTEHVTFDAAHFSLRRQPIDASVLVEDAVAMLTPAVAQQDMVLIPDVDGMDVQVSADYERMLRVFTNLVRNALRAGARGSVIGIRQEVTADGVRFSVSDQGSGLTAEQRRPIEDSGWRPADPAAPDQGLGLYIAKVIVAAHGGTLSVTSNGSDGTTLAFTVPRLGTKTITGFVHD